jgi:hypothetical protein
MDILERKIRAFCYEVFIPKPDGPDDEDVLTYESDSQSWIAAPSAGGGFTGLTGVIGITIDGGGSAITTGIKGYIWVPYAGTITKATLLADQSGSVVVDVWKDSYANYPPTVADTITASAKPTLSSAIKSQDTTLTGWTTSFSAGSTFAFNVDSASTITRLHVLLETSRA